MIFEDRYIAGRMWLGTKIAKVLGYKLWPSNLNEMQMVWGRTQKEADSVKWGQSLRHALPTKLLRYLLRPW